MIATLVVAAFFLVSAETYLATHARGVFKLAFIGVGPTELRILMAAGASAGVRGIRSVIVRAVDRATAPAGRSPASRCAHRR